MKHEDWMERYYATRYLPQAERLDICLNRCTFEACDYDHKDCPLRKAGREAENAYKRARYETHREQEVERVKQWQRANMDKVAAKQKRYHERRAMA